ncbi:MAG: ABC transporter ATP-binding protein [Chlamydiia bacterium]|nr:ABC transporter ATP-binding protein [Chlamydiia bacterium]
MEPTLFQNLIAVVKANKSKLIFASFLLFLANILTLSNPILLKFAIETPDRNVWLWALLLLIIAFGSSLLRYQMRVEFSLVSRKVEKDVRLKMFERVQNQSREFHDRHSVGELIERLSSDMGAYRDVIGPGLLFPVYFITMIIPGLCALIYISPVMGGLTAIPMLLIPLLNLLFRKKIYDISQKVQEKLAQMGKFVQEAFSGIRIVKSYVAEKTLNRQFEKDCTDLFWLNFRLMALQGAFFPLLVVSIKIVTVALVILAGLLFLSPADFASFMWIQSYIFFPLLILGWVIPIWQHGRASYDRLYQLYQEPIAVKGGVENHKIPEKPSIDITHLNFGYPDHPLLFEDLNLVIEGGSFTAITGPAGSGKSTLFKLLSRDYEIPRGMIAIGGRDIHDYPLDAFWEEVVTVDQIPFLFSKSIKENLKFAKKTASDEEVQLANELAALHEEVLDFEKGYDTLIGEKGVGLSGGQKSRLAIARAFLVDRSLLLLDDIFAALDETTALKIFETVKENYRGKTVVITTSKLKILEQMDKVVVLKQGKIIDTDFLKELKEIEDGL